jgi:hypothetical protein
MVSFISTALMKGTNIRIYYTIAAFFNCWINHAGWPCCGKDVYNPALQVCCDTTVYTIKGASCCKSKPYKPDIETCCVDTIYSIPNGQCCGKKMIYPAIEKCCNGVINSVVRIVQLAVTYF